MMVSSNALEQQQQCNIQCKTNAIIAATPREKSV